jgi:hypothetical protein
MDTTRPIHHTPGMTPHSGLFRRALVLVAVGGVGAASLVWSGAAQAAPLTPSASPTPAASKPPAAGAERLLLGWAGLTSDAPLADARIRILTSAGRDITKQVTGVTTPADCGASKSDLCTQGLGVIHVPLRKPLPANAEIVVTGGTLNGQAVTGSLRARARVVQGKPEHVTITLGSTVKLRLLNAEVAPRVAERRTLEALGFHPARSTGFTERHDAATLDRPGVIAALGRMGFRSAVDATVESALKRPGTKAPWLRAAEKVTAPQTRDVNPVEDGALKWVGTNIGSGILSGIGGKALNLFLGWLGFSPDSDGINKAVTEIEGQLDKDFSALQKEVLTGFSDLSDLVTAHATATNCQASRILVSNGISSFETSIDSSSNYTSAWNAYVTAISDEKPSPASVAALLQEMAKWSPGSMSKIGQVTYRSAFSPVGGTVSSTSIAAGWQADLQCLANSEGILSPLIADTAWPISDGKGSSGMPIAVQLGSYYTGVAGRGALLDSVFASFVQACGAAPTSTGTCPTGATGGAASITTEEVWAKVYNPKCQISVDVQVACSSVNYYATIANALISPVPQGTAVDFRYGNMWAMAKVEPSDSPVLLFDNSDRSGYELATRSQAMTLLEPATSVTAVGSAARVDNVGMPTSVGPLTETTYADVINKWFPASPSRVQAAAAACGTSLPTNFSGLGVARGVPTDALMGFTAGSKTSADCTGSYGVVLAERVVEPVCPTTLGAGSYSGPAWEVYAYPYTAWTRKMDYQGNSLSVGFGFPQPTGGSCAGWVYVQTSQEWNFWGLSPTGDQPDVAASPFQGAALEQLLLDGTQTGSSGGVSLADATDSGIDPGNYPSLLVNPLASYYAGLRYAPNDGTCGFRSDIVSNAIAIWGSGIPNCADVTVPTLVVRSTQPGDNYLFQDAWAKQHATTCPTWDRGSAECASDNTYLATSSSSVTLGSTPAAPTSGATAVQAWASGIVGRLGG